MVVDFDKFVGKQTITIAPMQLLVPSDTVLAEINSKYPRGFKLLDSGTVTVHTFNPATGQSEKLDLGDLSEGFEWSFSGFCGIALTAEDNSTPITATSFLAIP